MFTKCASALNNNVTNLSKDTVIDQTPNKQYEDTAVCPTWPLSASDHYGFIPFSVTTKNVVYDFMVSYASMINVGQVSYVNLLGKMRGGVYVRFTINTSAAMHLVQVSYYIIFK